MAQSMLRIQELITSLDSREEEKVQQAEDELVQMGEQAIEDVLQSVNEINRRLLARDNPEQSMGTLERRIKALGRIASPRGTKAILDALADSAGAVANLNQQMNDAYDHPNPGYAYQIAFSASPLKWAAESLCKTSTDALVSIGNPAIPLVQKYIGNSPPPVQKALKKALSRLQKKWWQFWK